MAVAFPPRRSALPCLPGNHGLQQHAAALDKNGFRVDAVALVDSDITGKPERCKLAARRWIGDDNTFQRARRSAQERANRYQQEHKNESSMNSHALLTRRLCSPSRIRQTQATVQEQQRSSREVYEGAPPTTNYEGAEPRACPFDARLFIFLEGAEARPILAVDELFDALIFPRPALKKR